MSTKDIKPLADEDVQRIVHDMLTDAISFVDDELGPEREKATLYYLGKPFAWDKDLKGRSKVVVTEVRDGVNGVMPSILEVFFGPEQVIEYEPSTPEKEPFARQATGYITKVFERSGGFMESFGVVKDGLVRKLGIYKWGWVERERSAHKLYDVSEDQLLLLSEDEGVTITKIEQYEDGGNCVHFLRVDNEGYPFFEAVPPEEFLLTRDARNRKQAPMLGHRTVIKTADLLAMGVTKDEIDEFGGMSAMLEFQPEIVARTSASGSIGEDGDDRDDGEANDKHEYVELYTRVDIDGDGHNELVRIPCLGESHHVLHDLIEEVNEIPFSWWCPDPEPHTAVGQSWADRLMDLQLIKSSLLRAAHDSAALAVFPRTIYREGRVSVADVMNTEIGAPIRATDVTDVSVHQHPFVGDKLLPFLQYADELAERRTGQNKGAMGLDADSLQSSTKGAVNAAVTASQAHIIMLCRLFAEQALKPLFKGLLRLYVERQPKIGSARINGEWTEVDPKTWDADYDVTINVALGRITPERIEYMARLVEGMGAVMQLAGPENPVFGFKEYGEAWRTAVSYMGYKNTARFVKPWMGDEEYAAQQEQAAQNQPPSPEMALVQVEQGKAQADAMKKQADAQTAAMKVQSDQTIAEQRLALDRERMQQEMMMARQKLEAEIALKVMELQIKTGVQLDIEQMKAGIAVAQSELQMQSQREQQRERMEHEQGLTMHTMDREDMREERRGQREDARFERTESRSERETGDKHAIEREKLKSSERTTLAVAEKAAEGRGKPAAPKQDEKPAKKKRVRMRKEADGSYIAEEE